MFVEVAGRSQEGRRGRSSTPAGPVSLALSERPRSYVNCPLHRSCPVVPKAGSNCRERMHEYQVSAALCCWRDSMWFLLPSLPSPIAHSVSCWQNPNHLQNPVTGESVKQISNFCSLLRGRGSHGRVLSDNVQHSIMLMTTAHLHTIVMLCF